MTSHIIPQEEQSQWPPLKTTGDSVSLHKADPLENKVLLSQDLTESNLQTCEKYRFNLDDPGFMSGRNPWSEEPREKMTWSPSLFPEKFKPLHGTKLLTLWPLNPEEAAWQKHPGWALNGSPTSWVQRRNYCGHSIWTKTVRSDNFIALNYQAQLSSKHGTDWNDTAAFLLVERVSWWSVLFSNHKIQETGDCFAYFL